MYNIKVEFANILSIRIRKNVALYFHTLMPLEPLEDRSLEASYSGKRGDGLLP
jgi:hypothetical protein